MWKPPHRRADAGNSQQSGILLHAARRLRTGRKKLDEAQNRDPGNPYIQANMRLLQDSYREGKAVQ